MTQNKSCPGQYSKMKLTESESAKDSSMRQKNSAALLTLSVAASYLIRRLTFFSFLRCSMRFALSIEFLGMRFSAHNWFL